ncbi:MAG: fumarylacetoacetate hydrolase family protein [Candidatus Bathyarchaeia archaeon]|jgi:2-keto-4-pentenoate hydratase/2-oxohepta-3-ene-1,7-dioic acid hydratase in catechol pathway
MKLVRYRCQNEETYGILTQQTVLCLPLLAKLSNITLPQELSDFIATPDSLNTADELLRTAPSTYFKAATVPLDEVSLLAPIRFPPKIIGLGWNYVDHASEVKIKLPEEPVIFIKPHTTIIGPYQKIVKPPFVRELDYEGELAIVIGKTAKSVSVHDAEKYIFGYTILNDVSARDFQFKDGQWTKGKSFDTFAPTGPCITTRDEISDVNNLRIRTWVNGDLRQNGTTKDMVFNVNQIVYHLSRFMTLYPCDIIATGTPSGVGMAMKPQTWLKDGDVIRIEIEDIGVLENTVEEK